MKPKKSKSEKKPASIDQKNKCTIAVMDKTKLVKAFKAYAWDNGSKAKVVLFIKKEKVVKQYSMKGIALRCCMNAVIKYWPKFDPAVHTLTVLKGHPDKNK